MTWIRPTNDLAPRALLVGDPGRALALAQQLLDAPLMFNHHRGLWGYTGAASDGKPLTIQATGIGGASAAAVLGDLCELGLRVAVRAGTCRAISATLAPGTLVAVSAAIAGDGASRALGAADQVQPDAQLTAALQAAVGHSVVVHSGDLYAGAVNGGAAVRDLATAAVLQVARVRGIAAGAVLAVLADDDGPEPVAALGAAAAAGLGL